MNPPSPLDVHQCKVGVRLKGHCAADCLCVSLSRKGAMVQTKSVDVGHDEEKTWQNIGYVFSAHRVIVSAVNNDDDAANHNN